MSILLNVDYGIIASLIKIKILNFNTLREGKSNLSSTFEMSWTWETYEIEHVSNTYSFFQFELAKKLSYLKGQQVMSKCKIIYN